MLTFDVTELLHDALRGDRRPPDGKLHPSGDLIGSLRHSMLRAAGAPTIESEITSDVRLMTGTLWHTYFEAIFRRNKLAVITELKLDPWLPEGWSGTADWIAWSEQYRAFVLGDLKTIKGEGMTWIEKDGIKEEHQWQLSSYWYALENMGLPLVKGYVVFYLPQNVPVDKPDVVPMLAEGMPLDRDLVLGTMNERYAQTREYLDEIEASINGGGPLFLNDKLAPVQDRVQAVRQNKKKDGIVFDVKLVPHWSAAYCPFPTELCDCSTQGQTKIGEYDLDGNYTPRKDHEDVKPTVSPSAAQLKKARAANADTGEGAAGVPDGRGQPAKDGD